MNVTKVTIPLGSGALNAHLTLYSSWKVVVNVIRNLCPYVGQRLMSLILYSYWKVVVNVIRFLYP